MKLRIGLLVASMLLMSSSANAWELFPRLSKGRQAPAKVEVKQLPRTVVKAPVTVLSKVVQGGCANGQCNRLSVR